MHNVYYVFFGVMPPPTVYSWERPPTFSNDISDFLVGDVPTDHFSRKIFSAWGYSPNFWGHRSHGGSINPRNLTAQVTSPTVVIMIVSMEWMEILQYHGNCKWLTAAAPGFRFGGNTLNGRSRGRPGGEASPESRGIFENCPKITKENIKNTLF